MIHYQAANNLPDGRSRFLAVMLGASGVPMLTCIDDAELEERRGLRAPRS